METTIKKIVVVLFTKNLELSLSGYGKGKFLEDIGSELSDIFDGEPVLVPLPTNAPHEFPRIILNSSDNSCSGTISLLRTDFSYNSFDNKNEEEEFYLFKNDSLRILRFLKSKNTTIFRIGFVVDIKIKQENGAAAGIIKEFIKEGKLEHPKEISIRFNVASVLDGMQINNLVSISGRSGKENVIGQIDINTGLENVALNIDEISFDKLIDYSIEKTKDIIKNFPNI